ncbi:MAG: MBL fold metallo-hydrolase [Spirochaetaceae bacterium]|jgi:glyoxylase-like metal-dependent hydrolase (beta-lactamase superfamily II)|nr:MBL fold metallo-hydrolase [Spirochaetaceae bacterium]
MKLHHRYCTPGFDNCYLLANEQGEDASEASADAILIDPGSMDGGLLSTIENNNYRLLAVLLTHDHKNHVRGIITLKKIYDIPIYAINPGVLGFKTNLVKDGDRLSIGSITIDVLHVPGHSSDSAIYLIDNMLFSGDAITAGLIGSTISSYSAAIEMTSLQSKIFSLPKNLDVFPGHGPPSSLEAAQRFNAGIAAFEEKRRFPQRHLQQSY